jgi:hypothetical protein
MILLALEDMRKPLEDLPFSAHSAGALSDLCVGISFAKPLLACKPELAFLCVSLCPLWLGFQIRESRDLIIRARIPNVSIGQDAAQEPRT